MYSGKCKRTNRGVSWGVHVLFWEMLVGGREGLKEVFEGLGEEALGNEVKGELCYYRNMV